MNKSIVLGEETPGSPFKKTLNKIGRNESVISDPGNGKKDD